MKKKEAESFARKKKIQAIDIEQLRANKYGDKQSNLCNVLDEFLKHKKVMLDNYDRMY